MRTKTILLLVGLPASGKSTYAFDLMKRERRWKRVSRDDIRLMLDGVEFDPKNESFVTKIEDASVEAVLRAGYDVIIDATHLNVQSRNKWLQFAAHFGDVKIISKNFDISLEDALRRNDLRNQAGAQNVSPDVIERMYDRYVKKNGLPKELDEYFPSPAFVQAEVDESLPYCVVCDLDGTLADNSWRNVYEATDCERDPVIRYVKDVLFAVHEKFGDSIIFVTGREEQFREGTEEFLTNAGFMWTSSDRSMRANELHMRSNTDKRKDYVVKKEIITEFRKRFNIRFCLEDRPRNCRMMRYELGLPVLQVADVEF